MVFALILRGHVRDSFQNNYLNELISYLSKPGRILKQNLGIVGENSKI
jgi:hypothetical protein